MALSASAQRVHSRPSAVTSSVQPTGVPSSEHWCESSSPLAPGMAFSVEPGIYFDGRFGARIEDIVVCGQTGPDTLNEAPRELRIVEG